MWHIGTADQNAPDRGFDIAGLPIFATTWQSVSRQNRFRIAGKDCNADPASLALRDRPIAEPLQLVCRKRMLLALRLLQTHHVRARLFQPAPKRPEALIDAVGCNLHPLTRVEVRSGCPYVTRQGLSNRSMS